MRGVPNNFATGSIKKEIDSDRGYEFSGDRKRVLPPGEPEYYVLAASEARALVVVTDRWSKIPWRKESFEPHRIRWDLIEEFLKERKVAKA